MSYRITDQNFPDAHVWFAWCLVVLLTAAAVTFGVKYIDAQVEADVHAATIVALTETIGRQEAEIFAWRNAALPTVEAE